MIGNLTVTLTVMLASYATFACAPESGVLGGEQSSCGASNELEDVQTYDGRFLVQRAFVNRRRLAVGLLKWRDDLDVRFREWAGNVSGNGWCTGTLIDKELFLTAAHCLEDDGHGSAVFPHEKGGVALSPNELARQFRVRFGFENPAEPGSVIEDDNENNSYDVDFLEEFRYNNLDYAILRLRGNPSLLHDVARISPRDAQAGDKIAILQHPGAGPMKIGAGTVAGVTSSRIAYNTINTEGGSSGAGILDAVTGKLVGVHTNGGCTSSGNGENFGVTIGALAAASPTIRGILDNSTDMLVGDFDGNSVSDLAIYREGCVHPDVDHDGELEQTSTLCPGGDETAEVFVGRWEVGQASSLGWRQGDCLYLDTSPNRPLCFEGENARFDLLVADWNGDGRSDLGIQKGRCIDFDTDLDGILDELGYCFGAGMDESQYLVGNWYGGARDAIAVRRGNNVLVDRDRDGVADATMVFGEGGYEYQYLTGDWNGDFRSDLAIRRDASCLFRYDDDGTADGGQNLHDTWAEP